MKSNRTITAIVFFSIITISATAQDNHSLLDESKRIRQGVVSGQLTGPEAARLKIDEARLRTEAIRYKTNDGRICRAELADLRRGNRRLSRNIFIQKHDRQRRF
jgi:hypothetical protein